MYKRQNNNIEVQNFCITPNGIHPDVEVALASTIPARPGFDAEYLITYRNKGNQTLSGGITLSYNAEVLDFVSSSETPASQVGALVNWTYLDLLPFESRSIYVTLNVNSPMESPAVNIDDILGFTVEAEPIAGDEFPSDNTFNFDQTVVGSFDPNDITCIEGDIVEPSEIGNYLHYLIRFENTGNAAAENVVVKTEVDPAQFDINTLRLLSTSHNADVRVTNNTIEFIFEDINLNASGGHGNILLRMRTKQNLDANDTVTKNAEIYFDYNFPIETNDANTTFTTLSVSDYEVDNSVSLYPNPVKNSLEHDEDGTFIKKWVPELANLPTPFVHEPYIMTPLDEQFNGFKLGENYPNIIIDIKSARKRASDVLWKMKKDKDVIKENNRILKKHTLSDRTKTLKTN